MTPLLKHLNRSAWIAVKSVVFCLVLVALLYAATFVFTPSPGTIQPWAAVAETAGQVDVLVLGSSTAYCSILPMELWRSAGVTALDVTSGALSMPATLAFYRQTRQAHRPRIVMLDVHMLGSRKAFDLENAHGAFDYMPVGVPWLEGIMTSVEPRDWFEVIFPLQRYHSRWATLGFWDCNPTKMTTYGYARGARYLPTAVPVSDTRAPIDKPEAGYLDELRYVKEIARQVEADGGQLVLFSAPSMNPFTVAGEPLLSRLERDLATEFPAIDYLDLDPVTTQVGVNPQTDYKNESHLNHRGAVKISRWLGDHLAQEYGLADHRGDSIAGQWNSDLAKYDALFIPGW